ncbi:hypothetical protein IKB17_00495 [bacterium]|nr:hypothetical protein [bacterium]
MVINSVLLSRISNKHINVVGEKILPQRGLEILAPAKAFKYDIISGNGKKGLFEQFVFKNKNNKIIQIFTRYLNQGSLKDVISDFSQKDWIFDVTTRTIENEDVKTKYTSLIPVIFPNKKAIFQKSFMEMSKNGDRGGIEILQEAKSPVGISFNYNYDCHPVELEYKNTNGKRLDITEEEARYLPLVPRKWAFIEHNGEKQCITVDFTSERVPEKIKLLQIIQEKLHNIEGVLAPIKSVEMKDLHLVKTSGKTLEQFIEENFTPLGENLGDGHINIVTNVDNNSDGVILLKIIAHEVQHAVDNIKMYLGGIEASKEALERVGITTDEFYKAHENEFKDLDINGYIQKLYDKFGLFVKGSSEYKESVDLYELNYKSIAVKDLKSVEEHDSLPLEKRAIEREFQQINFYNKFCQKIVNFLYSVIDDLKIYVASDS